MSEKSYDRMSLARIIYVIDNVRVNNAFSY